MAQTKSQNERLSTTRFKPQEPKNYDVYILNDDFTTFGFVVEVIMSVFMKTEAEAEEIASNTHIHQKAKIGTYPYDIAQSRINKATSLARQAGFPLRFTLSE